MYWLFVNYSWLLMKHWGLKNLKLSSIFNSLHIDTHRTVFPCMMLYNSKHWIFRIITPDFSVIGSFRNHSIHWFGAQETFLIITTAENSQYFVGELWHRHHFSGKLLIIGCIIDVWNALWCSECKMYSVVQYWLVVPYHLSYSFNKRGSSESLGWKGPGHFLQMSFFTFQRFYTFLCFFGWFERGMLGFFDKLMIYGELKC